MMKLGYRIYVQMKELGLTQAQLADRSGLSQQIISNYINNKFKPGFDAILALSSALEIKPEWFFDDSAVPAGDIIAFGKIQRGGTLRIGHFLPMDDLPSPVSLQDRTGIAMNLYWLMFDKLVRVYALGGPKAGIAYNWKQSGKYWLFDLVEGVTFHDGQICTAEDVEYSYKEWISHNAEDNPIQTVQMIDNHEFLLELKKECKLADIPMPFIVPKGFGSEPTFIGTGPFKAMEIQGNFWRLQSHDNYHHSKPFFDEVIVKRFQNPDELENALRKEQVDLAVGIDLKDESFGTQTEAAAQRYELVFRLDSPLCSDIRFRQAIYYGLDRAAIAKAADLREPLFAKGAFDYVLDDFSDSPPEPEIQRARELLSEIPNINEARLSFEISSVDPKREKIVSEIIAQLNTLGIKTEIVNPPADATVVLFNTTTRDLERQIWIKDGTINLAGYHNPTVEKLLNSLDDVSMDNENLKQIQMLIKEDCPSIPLFYKEWAVSYVQKLRALENRMILMTMLHDMHAWYFESEVVQFPERTTTGRRGRRAKIAVG